MFLLLERRTQAMHVGGLELLVPPKGARTGWLTRQVARLHQATATKPPFNQRLHRKLGSWYWRDDERFDLGAHLHHHSLPPPGRIRELLSLVSELHAVPLDRARPLWEFHVIEGLERSEEHTSELQSLMRISYAVFCLKKQNNNNS